MKKILFFIAAAAIGVALAVGCSSSTDEPGGNNGNVFDKSLLSAGSGEWVYTRDYGSGPEQIKLTFKSDGTGFQTTADQPEPQTFTWSLNGSRLAFVHKAEMGASVPEDCTLVTLTATSLIFTNENGTRISCTKSITN